MGIQVPPKLILSASQSMSDEFNVAGNRVFILLKDHAGGTWDLEVMAPDGDWVVIADDSGGVQFDSDGLVLFYGMPWMTYRLNSGNAGAKAWVAYGDPIPGFKA